MSLIALNDETVRQYTSVKRQEACAPYVGQMYALDGAWDRKKICVKVGRDENGDYVLLQNVGRIFSDGRYMKPSRKSPPIKQRVFPADTKLPWYMRHRYVPVVPGKNPAKELRPITHYGHAGRVYRKQWVQQRIAELEAQLKSVQDQLNYYKSQR